MNAVEMNRIVIVGAGQAGLETAVVLRESGYRGHLTLLGAETHLPYERPPLSKDVLAYDAEITPLDANWDELDLDLRLGCRAVALHDGVLEASDGQLPFDGLAIATGAVPLQLPGAAAPNIHTLRTIDDALALRAALAPGARVVVVGAGWIGAEVATAAVRRGCAVTVVEASAAPLAAALPREIGERTVSWYEQAQVQLRLGVRVVSVDRGVVQLDNGESLAADCIVVGIGVRPETSWLQGSGLSLDKSGRVIVDSTLQTTRPGVVAVGDCAAWQSRRFGARLHVEHWDNAQRAPAVAALTLLGESAIYDPVPYFWSESFDRMIQYAGHGTATDTLVVREASDAGGWTVCWVRDERLTAILGVDRPRDVTQGRRLIADGGRVDVASLQDADVPLKDAVRAPPSSS